MVESFDPLAESFLGESFDPPELSEPPPGEPEELEDEDEDASDAVPDLASEAAEDLSPDSLLSPFFLASDG